MPIGSFGASAWRPTGWEVTRDDTADWDPGVPPAESQPPLGPDEQPCQRGGMPVPCDTPGASYAYNPGMEVSRPWLERTPAAQAQGQQQSQQHTEEQPPLPPKAELSTGVKIGIGVAALGVVGAIAYFATRGRS